MDGIEFGWLDDAPADAATLMTVNTGYVKAGIKTINEARAEIGLGPVPGGDTPLIETPTRSVPVGKEYNPNEPRDSRGRWTSEDDEDEDDSSENELTGFQPVDFVPTMPVSPEFTLPDWFTKPVPDFDPGPSALPYKIPSGLSDEECKGEWDKAQETCEKYDAQGYFKDPNRWLWRDIEECKRGQVRAECGGNPVDTGPSA